MIAAFIGKKLHQTQTFTSDGRRIPVTVLFAEPLRVLQIKTVKTDGYASVQVGVGARRAGCVSKPLLGHVGRSRPANSFPSYIRELPFQHRRESDEQKPLDMNTRISLAAVFQVGDAVSVSGISKGKGFQGVVRRHHFRGGPRTHGQSDRERAPGSIGQTTTPGRVYKGKRMAGRMGGHGVTVRHLRIVAIDDSRHRLTVSGLVPGARDAYIVVQKT